MSYEIRVSKKGYDAQSEKDPNNYTFHSAYNTFKILKHGTGSFTVAATSNETETITHNYGTILGFIIFFKHPNGRVTYINNIADDADATSVIVIRGSPQVRNSDTTISFTAYNGAGTTQTVYYSYYLFEIPL